PCPRRRPLPPPRDLARRAPRRRRARPRRRRPRQRRSHPTSHPRLPATTRLRAGLPRARADVMALRTRCVACTAFALLVSAGGARAETPEQAADRLFKEAEVLARAGRYAEACPKLEESERLDPGIGTQFNLADCYERTGRVAHAYLV